MPNVKLSNEVFPAMLSDTRGLVGLKRLLVVELLQVMHRRGMGPESGMV